MTVELAAVRALAPWFGTSTAVWTNVIGVVLLALSLGYLVGARASRHASPARMLGIALGSASVFAALVPVASAPVARWFLPENLGLDEAGTLMRYGSLAASMCLFLPPALALGCVSPLCAEVLERRAQSSAGRAGGLVLCASTLGSLLGTFGTTYVLVPELGLTRTFVAAAFLLAVLACTCFLALRAKNDGPRALVLAFLPVPLVAQFHEAEMPNLRAGTTLLEARESTYQSVRVVESNDRGERLRFLQVNECFDSFQSVWQERAGFLPEGYYYNHFAFPLWWSRAVKTWRVAIVGFGAGTAWRVLDGARPADVELHAVGAEIDPVVHELATRWMDAPVSDPRCKRLAEFDGRALLDTAAPPFDLIVLDAYANQVEIPPHLASLEFFQRCHASLADQGWLVANVGGFGFDDPVVDAVGRTLARAFAARVLALHVPFSRNIVLVARRAAEPCEPGSPQWSTGEPEVDRRLSSQALPGAWFWFAPSSADVLTDDRNPIQELQRLSIEHAAGRDEP